MVDLMVKTTDSLRLLTTVNLKEIKTEEEYYISIKEMYRLLDIVGEDESHPLAEELNSLADSIWAYEEIHYPCPV